MTEPIATKSPQAWREPNIGPSWQHRLFAWVLKYRGKRRAYQFAAIAAFWYVLFYPSVRKRCRPYLSRRFPGEGRFWHTVRLVKSFATTLVDAAALNVLGPEALAVACPDHERLIEIAGEGKGIILLFAHAGCWQVGMSTLKQFGRPVSVVMIPEPRTTAVFDSHDVAVIDPRTGLPSVMAMTESLLSGQIVAMMGDRTFGDEQNKVAATFLGDPIKLPMTAYRLASATGAPVVVLMAPKTGRDAYELRIAAQIDVSPKLGREPAKYAVYARQFADTLGQFVQDYPYQFYNFYDVWEKNL